MSCLKYDKLFKKAYTAINDSVLAESSFVSADVDIIYHSKITRLDEDFILTELNNALPKERLAKVSIYGVHRDDFNFEINGKNVGLFFSRGICRIISYFFQLSECDVPKADFRFTHFIIT